MDWQVSTRVLGLADKVGKELYETAAAGPVSEGDITLHKKRRRREMQAKPTARL